MDTMRFHARALWCAFLIGVVSLCFLYAPSLAQTQTNKREERPWKNRLNEKGVKYEDHACSKEDSQIITEFFKDHPLRSILPICHNDCPVITCRPVVPFPPIAKAARVVGTVSVHVLVDETGKVLYARVLSGHPLLWAAARIGACQTQFKEYRYGKHQGVMHFTVNGYDFLGVPNRANEVW